MYQSWRHLEQFLFYLIQKSKSRESLLELLKKVSSKRKNILFYEIFPLSSMWHLFYGARGGYQKKM